jgi:molecular chaperone DnaK
VIKSSGGLSEDDIEKMVRDAEANAEADATRRKTIEARNEIDSMIYSTEKSLTDNADKLDDETKEEINKAIAEAKEVKDSEDLEVITAKKEALSQASSKIGQAIYSQQKEGEEKKDDDTTEDADFKEKDDEKKEGDEEKKDDEKKDEEKKESK